MGKSTAPLAAASSEGIGYTVLQPGIEFLASLFNMIKFKGMDVLASIAKKTDEVLNAKFPKGGEEESVIREMKDVFLHGLTHVFQKCEALISKQGSSLLYNAKLNDYDGSTFDSVKRSTLEKLATQAINALLVATGNVSKSNHFILHFDEMQSWATSPFRRDPKRQVSPSDFSRYRLIALSEVLLVFKGRNIRFAFSGTNIEQGRVLRISSQVKIFPLSLPLFSEMAVLQLLDLLCNAEHLDREQLRVKIGSYLAGCVRSCEYFFDDIHTKFATTPAEQVTVEDLEKVGVIREYRFEFSSLTTNLFQNSVQRWLMKDGQRTLECATQFLIALWTKYYLPLYFLSSWRISRCSLSKRCNYISSSEYSR